LGVSLSCTITSRDCQSSISLKPQGDPGKLESYDRLGTPDFIVFECVKR
jgi:hypothetical protein